MATAKISKNSGYDASTDMRKEKILNFMFLGKPAFVLSAVLIVVSIGALVTQGLKLGLDFTGGAQVEVSFDKTADLEPIREMLAEKGLQNPIAVYFGSDNDVLIRTQGAMEDGALTEVRQRLAELNPEAEVELQRPNQEDSDYVQILMITGLDITTVRQAGLLSADYYGRADYRAVDQGVQVLLEKTLDAGYTDYLLAQLAQVNDSGVTLVRSEFVGPQVGNELRDDGGIGLLVALLMVMVYVAVRFQYKFSVGAVLSQIHDVIIVMGFFALFQIDFDLTVLAAVLAVVGYSINDTIVVYDRIRENFPKLRRADTVEVINVSLTQVYERTLITSLTTLMVLTMLYIFGGAMIQGFALALIIGVTVGTYSSIYVAANLLLTMKLTREDLLPPEREEAEVDQMP